MSQAVHYEQATRATNGGVLVGAASVEVLPARARAEFVIYNVSNSAMWVAFGEAAEANKGVQIPAGGTLKDTSWGGSVHAMTADGTANKQLIFLEKHAL